MLAKYLCYREHQSADLVFVERKIKRERVVADLHVGLDPRELLVGIEKHEQLLVDPSGQRPVLHLDERNKVLEHKDH